MSLLVFSVQFSGLGCAYGGVDFEGPDVRFDKVTRWGR